MTSTVLGGVVPCHHCNRSIRYISDHASDCPCLNPSLTKPSELDAIRDYLAEVDRNFGEDWSEDTDNIAKVILGYIKKKENFLFDVKTVWSLS